MQDSIGADASPEKIKNYLWSTLNSGRVIPGCVLSSCAHGTVLTISTTLSRYGHGVLRDPDPRFIALQTFCEVRPELRDSPIINLVKKTAQVAPGVLTEHGKVRDLLHGFYWIRTLTCSMSHRLRIPTPMLMLRQV